MNNDTENRIIRYLDNQMNSDERTDFENELKKNETLQLQFEDYKNILKDFSANNFKESVSSEYFNSIIPAFREKLNKEKSHFIYRKIGYAFAAVLLISIGAWLFTSNELEEDKIFADLNINTENLTDTEINELLTYLNGSMDYEQAGDAYSYLDSDVSELSGLVSEQVPDLLISEIDINEIYKSINLEESEIIFNELINKNFNKEVQL